MDLGVRKPHAVLVGGSLNAISVRRLKELGLRGCRIHLEEGCPRHELYAILGDNQIFTVDGKLVKALRDANGKAKSDLNDALHIRELALKQPEVFRRMTAREAEEVLDEMAYGYYSRITRLVASLAIYRKTFVRQFGESPAELESAIEIFKRQRSKVAYRFEKFDPVVKILGVRGLGVITVAAVFTQANPKRFRSLQTYLRYCGPRAEARAVGKYSRRIKAVYHQLACGVIMHRDSKFYALYQEIKGNLRGRFPLYRKSKIDGMARHRLATPLAKHVFLTLRSVLPVTA